MQIIFFSMDVLEDLGKQWPWQSSMRTTWQSRHSMAVSTCQLAEVRCVWGGSG